MKPKSYYEEIINNPAASHDNKWEAAYHLVSWTAQHEMINKYNLLADIDIDKGVGLAVDRLVRYFKPEEHGAGMVVRIARYAAARANRDIWRRNKRGYSHLQALASRSVDLHDELDPVQARLDRNACQSWQANHEHMPYYDETL